MRSGNVKNPQKIIYFLTNILEEIKSIPPEDLANILLQNERPFEEIKLMGIAK